MSRYPNWVSMCLNQHTHSLRERERNILLHTLAGGSALCVLVRLSAISPSHFLHKTFAIVVGCHLAGIIALEINAEVQAEENINRKRILGGPRISLSMTDRDGEVRQAGKAGGEQLPDKSLVNFLLGHCLQQAHNCLAASQDGDAAGKQRSRGRGNGAGNPLS